jgi:hypothetical protein
VSPTQRTKRFTLRFLGANPPANGGQVILALEDPGGFPDITAAESKDELCNRHFDWTSLDARFILALQASFRFLQCHLWRQPLCDLKKVRPPVQSFLLGHRLAWNSHPLFCA